MEKFTKFLHGLSMIKVMVLGGILCLFASPVTGHGGSVGVFLIVAAGFAYAVDSRLF